MKDFKSHTIRRRLIILFGATVGFVILLASTYSVNIFALKSDVIAIENFSTLLNNVLELRRYEKNFIYGVGSDNFQQIIFYLDTIENDTNKLNDSIVRTAGITDYYLIFRKNLVEYRSEIKKKLDDNNPDFSAIRSKGKAMVDFTQQLLNIKKERIHRALDKTLFGFIMATGGTFFFIFLVFHFQARNVLHRLAILQDATKEVASGDFTPIEEDATKQDEISNLIQAFNKMAAEIESKQEQLVRSRRLAAIGTFSSGIAHELNNPLNNISLTADTLQEEYGTVSEAEAREMISDIIVQTDRASGVVKNLLDFCRDTPPAQAKLNIRDVVEGTAKLIRNQLRLESIWLEDYMPVNLPLIQGDLQKLQQVFLNFFLNSIHAMSGGGLIHIEGKVDPAGYVRVDFNDTGTGIPAEKLEHIFDPFYTTKPVGQGTGLGLSIVYAIIKKHGGYIEVRSKVNVGTTFSVFFPIVSNNLENGNDHDTCSSN
jgi:signal transduction histidine kinase